MYSSRSVDFRGLFSISGCFNIPRILFLGGRFFRKVTFEDVAGIDESKHFHSLRHTYAVRQRVKGIPMAMIQALMGHKSIDTTEQYANIDLKKLRRHFPTLLPQYTDEQIKAEKVSKSSIGDTLLGDTRMDSRYFHEKKLVN